MNAQEKKITEKVSKRLRSCARPPFSTGDLAKWSAWANDMQSTIHASVDTLDGLTESSVEDKKNLSEEDFLSKNLEE